MVKMREELAVSFLPEEVSEPVEWVIADGLVGYDEAVAEMEARAGLIADGLARERVWLVDSRCSAPGEAGSSPITAPASAWPMSCWT